MPRRAIGRGESGCVSNRSDQRSASGRLLSGWLAEVPSQQLIKIELRLPEIAAVAADAAHTTAVVELTPDGHKGFDVAAVAIGAADDLRAEHGNRDVMPSLWRAAPAGFDLALKVASNFNGSPDAGFASTQPRCNLTDHGASLVVPSPLSWHGTNNGHPPHQ